MILDHSQGTLLGQPNKVLCGVRWLYMRIPDLPLCWRMIHLQDLLKFYDLIKHSLKLCIANTDFRPLMQTSFEITSYSSNTLLVIYADCVNCNYYEMSDSNKLTNPLGLPKNYE